MGLIENFKRDIARNRGRSAVLGVLFVAMVLFSIRAGLQLSAKPVAAAAVISAPQIVTAPISSADTLARVKESQELWQKLREKKTTAANTAVAFRFDSAFYPAPVVAEAPRKTAAAPEPERPSPTIPDPGAAKRARIHEQARSLVLKSTMVGEGIAQPAAIINQKLLTTGQEINGFSITAIRAREVEVLKEGQTEIVKMPDGQ